MNKKQLVFSAIISAFAIVVVFGFASFIANRAQVWSAQHRMLNVPLMYAVNAGSLIQGRPIFAAVIVVAACFGLVWILARLSSKQASPKA